MANKSGTVKRAGLTSLPRDLDPQLSKFLGQLRNEITTMQGLGKLGTASKERAVTVRELERMGLNVEAEYDVSSIEKDPSIGDGVPPGPPRDLIVTAGMLSNVLEWTNPPDTDVSHVEVWVSASGSRSDAAKVAVVGVYDETRNAREGYVHSKDPATDYWYWVRAVDASGLYSTWEPPDTQGGYFVPGDTDISETIDKFMTYLQDRISESHLTSTLAQRIGQIDGLESDMELSRSQFFVKLQKNQNGEYSAAGFGMEMYPDWEAGRAYSVGETVVYTQTVGGKKIGYRYRARSAVPANKVPPSNPAYWEQLSGVADTDFIVLTDNFYIATPYDGATGSRPIFGIVTTSEGTHAAALNGDLIADGSIVARMLSTDELITGSAQIKDATIGNAHIKERLDAAKIKVEDLEVNQMNLAGVQFGPNEGQHGVVIDFGDGGGEGPILDIRGQMKAAHIQTNGITADKIATNAIEAEHIAAGAVTAKKIAVGAVSDVELAINAATISETWSATEHTITASGDNWFTIKTFDFTPTWPVDGDGSPGTRPGHVVLSMAFIGPKDSLGYTSVLFDPATQLELELLINGDLAGGDLYDYYTLARYWPDGVTLQMRGGGLVSEGGNPLPKDSLSRTFPAIFKRSRLYRLTLKGRFPGNTGSATRNIGYNLILGAHIFKR